MTCIVKIDKLLSNGRMTKYILDIEEKDGESVCSIEISSDNEVARADDVCRDPYCARKFLDTLAEGSVEPCHLQDIVSDSLPL